MFLYSLVCAVNDFHVIYPYLNSAFRRLDMVEVANCLKEVEDGQGAAMFSSEGYQGGGVACCSSCAFSINVRVIDVTGQAGRITYPEVKHL